MKTWFLIVFLVCGLGACSSAPPATAVATSVLKVDFSAELPKTPSPTPTPGEIKVIDLVLGGVDEPVLKVQVQPQGPHFMKTVEVVVAANPGQHEISAELGKPTNEGTIEVPMMSVPLRVTWSNTKTKSRTDMWYLSLAKGLRKV